jgi:hypothetical protein
MPTAAVLYKSGCENISHTVCVCVFSLFTLPGITEEESITYALKINTVFKHSFSQ